MGNNIVVQILLNVEEIMSAKEAQYAINHFINNNNNQYDSIVMI